MSELEDKVEEPDIPTSINKLVRREYLELHRWSTTKRSY